VLAPVVGVANQLERLPAQGMEWMDDSETLRTVRIICS